MDSVHTLSERQSPAFLHIVDALTAGIASGRLVRGPDRSPTGMRLSA